MLTKKLINFISKFHFGFDAQTETDLYLIPRANKVHRTNPDLTMQLLQRCEKLEKSVWKKKFSILHSTFELDYVFLFVNNKKLAGFASAGVFEIQKNLTGLYISEVMIGADFQKNGFAKIAVSMFQNEVFNRIKKENTLYMLTVSGHIGVYKSLAYSAKKKSYYLEELGVSTQNCIKKYLRRDIYRMKIGPRGVIRNIWENQPVVTKQVWPHAIAKKINLPTDVDLSKGDAVLKVYELNKKLYRKNLKVLQNRIGAAI